MVAPAYTSNSQEIQTERIHVLSQPGLPKSLKEKEIFTFLSLSEKVYIIFISAEGWSPGSLPDLQNITFDAQITCRHYTSGNICMVEGATGRPMPHIQSSLLIRALPCGLLGQVSSSMYIGLCLMAFWTGALNSSEMPKISTSHFTNPVFSNGHLILANCLSSQI